MALDHGNSNDNQDAFLTTDGHPFFQYLILSHLGVHHGGVGGVYTSETGWGGHPRDIGGKSPIELLYFQSNGQATFIWSLLP